MLLACNFPEHFAALQCYRSENDGVPLEAEQSILGIDHAAIGSLLGRHWHFPQTICNAIATHHCPDESGNVHIADALAHALDLTGSQTEMVPCISPYCWNRVGLSWSDSRWVFVEIEHEFDMLSKAQLTSPRIARQ